MKKWFVPVLLLLSVSLFGTSGEYRIAILDLDVLTSRDDYQYVGKGIAEMLAFELRNEKYIQIIEREKRNIALEELNFSLTGLSDESEALELGRLLTANYLVVGDIIEMDKKFLITIKLMDVETSVVIWQDQLLTRLNNASAVSQYFAGSLIAGIIGDGGEERSSAELIFQQEGLGEDLSGSLIAFSAAVDAIDEGDKETARTELSQARSIDPESRVVRHFLDLLSVVAPKYKYELRPYGPVYNPAYLPRNTSDRFYIWESLPMGFLQEKVMYEVTPEISTYEADVVATGGYFFPVGDRHGFDIEFSWTYLVRQTSTTVPYDYDGQSLSFAYFGSQSWSLILGYGYAVSDFFSLGLAFQPSIVDWSDSASAVDPDDTITFQYSLTLGSLLTLLHGRMLCDVQFVYSNYPQYYAIEDDQTYYKGTAPFLIETSIIGSVVPEKLFLSMKGNVDIFLDNRAGFFIRAIPIAEFWPARFLALRAGYQLSVLNQLGFVVVGQGVTGGFSLKFGKWDFDAAYSHSMNPSTNVAGYLTPLNKLHFGLTRSGNFIGR